MGRKKVIRIPASAVLKCPHCGKTSRIKIPKDSCIYFYNCKKCKTKLETPQSQCCIICAFTKKRCAVSLMQEAKLKGLEIKRE